MDVIIITGDKTVFDPNSPGATELLRATASANQAHVIVLTEDSDRLTMGKLGEKTFLYPTGSKSERSYASDAVKLAERELMVEGILVADIVEAGDPFLSAVAASELSKKYRKNFIVNITEDIESTLSKKSYLSKKLYEPIPARILPAAHGVRVPNQLIAESVSAAYGLDEDKVFILASRAPTKEEEAALVAKFRSQYPQFNVLIVTVLESKSDVLIERLKTLASALRTRYKKIGLIIIDNQEFHKPGLIKGLFKKKSEELPFIVWERGIKDLASYYKSAHIYIDANPEAQPGGALTEAALFGAPLVAAPSPASEAIVQNDENGYIADPDSIDDFCGRIAQILETPGLREMFKLLRYETDKINIRTGDAYSSGVVEIWKVVVDMPGNFEAIPETVSEPEPQEAEAQAEAPEGGEVDETLTKPEPVLEVGLIKPEMPEEEGGLVHTLGFTREYARRLAKSIKEDIGNVGRPKVVEGRMDDVDRIETVEPGKVFDVDSAMK